MSLPNNTRLGIIALAWAEIGDAVFQGRQLDDVANSELKGMVGLSVELEDGRKAELMKFVGRLPDAIEFETEVG